MAAPSWMLRTNPERVEGFLAKGDAARGRGEHALAERFYVIASALEYVASVSRVHGERAERHVAAEVKGALAGSPAVHLALVLLRREREGREQADAHGFAAALELARAATDEATLRSAAAAAEEAGVCLVGCNITASNCGPVSRRAGFLAERIEHVAKQPPHARVRVFARTVAAQ